MRLRIVAVRLPTVSLSPGPAIIRPAESACRTCWLCSLGVTSSPWKRWNRLMDKRASRPGLSDIHKRSSALSSGGAMRNLVAESALTLWLFVECSDAKKYCWYFEGGYPIYFICRSYEDCCGTRCCVRALSIHRLWYFWVLLMMGILFCCGAGFFIRRRMYPSPLRDDPAFNVSFTRHPVTSPVSQQPGSIQGYGVNGMAGGEPGVTVPLPVYPAQPASAHKMMASYPPPPSYCNHPPPPYEQVFQNSDKK